MPRALKSNPLWIFGYGSLMWDPGFAFAERHPALLRGYHRAFCMSSIRHRGTPETPGLVLGLKPGGACRGLAYRVAAKHAKRVRAYLFDREMPHYIYLERFVPITLADGRRVAALTYVADVKHARYAGDLSEREIGAIIRAARGGRGSNVDYLKNVVGHLDELGIADGPLHELWKRVGRGEVEAKAKMKIKT